MWTQTAYNYAALSTAPTLIFALSAGGLAYNYLDDVSVVDTSASSIQLLINPSFENSTTNLTGWTTWCATAACNSGGGALGKVTTSSCNSGNCYIDHCRNPSYDYLVQSFPVTIGHIYTVSFWYKTSGFGVLIFDVNVEG